MATSSKHLNEKQIRALNRLGDCYLPGGKDFPSFSKCGCASQVDRILDYMPAGDLADLKMLLGILAFFPRFILSWFVSLIEFSPRLPGPSVLRFIRLGLRGLAFSLYYSAPVPLEAIEYRVSVYLGE